MGNGVDDMRGWAIMKNRHEIEPKETAIAQAVEYGALWDKTRSF